MIEATAREHASKRCSWHNNLFTPFAKSLPMPDCVRTEVRLRIATADQLLGWNDTSQFLYWKWLSTLAHVPLLWKRAHAHYIAAARVLRRTAGARVIHTASENVYVRSAMFNFWRNSSWREKEAVETLVTLCNAAEINMQGRRSR